MDSATNISLANKVIGNLKNRADRLHTGKINSIPSPFKRFSSEFIGIEQGKMYLISSFTKGGKTQFVSYVFIFNTIFYAFTHKDTVRVKFFMYLLEETKDDMMLRFMSHLLYKLSEGKYEYSPTELMSSNNTAIPKEVLEFMESTEFRQYTDFFESCIEFSDSANPTGVYNECLKYAREHGKEYTKEKKYKDDLGQTQAIQGFDRYEPDDPDEYRIILVDHVSLIQCERGFTLKQAIDKLGEYAIILRNRYNFIPILIQQQNTDQESIDAFKLNKLRPTVAGLADSKYSGRNCNVFLGLFSPMRQELREYMGYDISKFKDEIRFLEVVLNRGGRMGGMIALYFNGAVCDYKELPPPSSSEIQKWYDWIDRKRNRKARTFLIRVKQLFKLKTNG